MSIDSNNLIALFKNGFSDPEISQRYPLHFAIFKGCKRKVKNIVKNYFKDNSFLEIKGNQAVSIDVKRDDLINLKTDEEFGRLTPLHIAVIVDDVKTASFLLKNGAFADLEDDQKKAPFDYALGIGNPKMIKLLRPYPSSKISDQEVLAEIYESNENRKFYAEDVRFLHLLQSHIDHSKEAILNGCLGISGTALVLGCGNGLEIPLEELANQFKSLILVDIDSNALNHAILKVPLELRSKCKLLKCDITGVYANFLKEIQVLIEKHPSDGKKALEEFFESLVKEYLSLDPFLPIKQYLANYVISSLLLSQIYTFLFLQISKVFNEKYRINEDLFLKNLGDMYVKFQHKHLGNLKNWTAINGNIYLSYTDKCVTCKNYFKFSKKSMVKKDDIDDFINKTCRIVIPEKSWKWNRSLSEDGQSSYFKVRSIVLSPK